MSHLFGATFISRVNRIEGAARTSSSCGPSEIADQPRRAPRAEHRHPSFSKCGPRAFRRAGGSHLLDGWANGSVPLEEVSGRVRGSTAPRGHHPPLRATYQVAKTIEAMTTDLGYTPEAAANALTVDR
jgi:hypothetical protein